MALKPELGTTTTWDKKRLKLLKRIKKHLRDCPNNEQSFVEDELKDYIKWMIE